MIQIVTIEVVDVQNPIELQTWFTNNPSITLEGIERLDRIFYIFYQ